MAGAQERSRFAAIFAGGTMLSRVFGMVRDMVMSFFISAAVFDVFIVAFRLPNMLREWIGEGASNAAFIPVLTETHETKSKEEFRNLVSAGLSAMLVLLIILTILGLFLLPVLLSGLDFVQHFTGKPPMDPERIDYIIRMATWTFPYVFFICLAVYCMAPLFTLGHYSTPSWSPVLLNLSLIGMCWLGRGWFAEPIYALITGVWIGGIAQLLALYIAMGRVSGVWLPNFQVFHPGVRRMFFLLIPVLFGQAASEVNKLVDTLFAYGLNQDGVVRGLFLANRMVQLPLSIFGAATAVAILPSISRAAANGKENEIRETLMEGYRQTFYLLFPAFLGLVVLAKPIIRLLFERGQFGPEGTEIAATALMLYAAGLLAFGWVKIGVTGYYAVQNTRTPVIIASCSMLLNILLNMALVGILGYSGLALATTIAFITNAVFLYLFLGMRFGRLWDGAFFAALSRMVIAGLLMAVVAWGTHRYADRLMDGDGIAARLVVVLVPILVAVFAYAGLSKALALDEWERIETMLRKRIG